MTPLDQSLDKTATTQHDAEIDKRHGERHQAKGFGVEKASHVDKEKEPERLLSNIGSKYPQAASSGQSGEFHGPTNRWS
jgi:hypothetical protein